VPISAQSPTTRDAPYALTTANVFSSQFRAYWKNLPCLSKVKLQVKGLMDFLLQSPRFSNFRGSRLHSADRIISKPGTRNDCVGVLLILSVDKLHLMWAHRKGVKLINDTVIFLNIIFWSVPSPLRGLQQNIERVLRNGNPVPHQECRIGLTCGEKLWRSE